MAIEIKPFPDLEVLQWEDRRSFLRTVDDLVPSDEVLTLTVRFEGGPPFQVVVSGPVGRAELERISAVLIPTSPAG
jgi:hypothetical protein